jgi:hypothetical protein
MPQSNTASVPLPLLTCFGIGCLAWKEPTFGHTVSIRSMPAAANSKDWIMSQSA